MSILHRFGRISVDDHEIFELKNGVQDFRYIGILLFICLIILLFYFQWVLGDGSLLIFNTYKGRSEKLIKETYNKNE